MLDNKLKFLRNQKKLDFSMSDLYRTIFCSCRSKYFEKSLKRKMRLYNACENEIEEYLNIELLVKRIKEIEFLKYIFMNKDQILSFDYFEKPEISVNDTAVNRKRHSMIAHQQITLPSEEKLEKIIAYYKLVNSTDTGGSKEKEINKKIYGLLNDELKAFIQSN